METTENRYFHRGDVVRHFKGGMYVILGIGTHTETREALVTYQSLKDQRVWVRPYSMFTSKVDKEKYPDATQEYRMVKMNGVKFYPEVSMNINTIAKSIETYGREKQSVVCMEECAELIQCISKELRGKSDLNHLSEEMADVLICLEMPNQMYHVGYGTIQDWIDKKQNREESRMESHE